MHAIILTWGWKPKGHSGSLDLPYVAPVLVVLIGMTARKNCECRWNLVCTAVLPELQRMVIGDHFSFQSAWKWREGGKIPKQFLHIFRLSKKAKLQIAFCMVLFILTPKFGIFFLHFEYYFSFSPHATMRMLADSFLCIIGHRRSFVKFLTIKDVARIGQDYSILE